jgi:hypothetical protein
MFGIRDLNKFIPDPGGKKAPDPGSGSPTQEAANQILKISESWNHAKLSKFFTQKY